MKILFLLLPCLFCHSLMAQSSEDFLFFNSEVNSVNTPLAMKADSTVIIVNKDKNELAITANVVFGLYRNLISSQDGSVCSFHPSCSAYCRHAVRKNGFLKGGLQSLDRILRCNNLSPEKYQIDLKRRKLLDHVD